MKNLFKENNHSLKTKHETMRNTTNAKKIGKSLPVTGRGGP
jgi:hypothetical protein